MNKNGITRCRAWASAILLMCLGTAWLPALAQGQTIVQAVSSQSQGGVEVVRIDFSQPLQAVPAGFTIQAPARIALDVPGASNGLGRNTIEINQGNVRSVNVVQAGERTRLVVNLNAPAAYKAQLQGKSPSPDRPSPPRRSSPRAATSRPSRSATWISVAARTARGA
jgi:type IV pilus assembly protein PilQ